MDGAEFNKYTKSLGIEKDYSITLGTLLNFMKKADPSLQNLTGDELVDIYKSNRSHYDTIFKEDLRNRGRDYGIISNFTSALMHHDNFMEMTKDLTNKEAEKRQLLLKKGQIILYGPPGTGKTYNTKKMAVSLFRNQ